MHNHKIHKNNYILLSKINRLIMAEAHVAEEAEKMGKEISKIS